MKLSFKMTQSFKNPRIDFDDFVEDSTPMLEFNVVNKSEKEYKKFHRIERKTTFSINHNLNSVGNLIVFRIEFEDAVEKLLSEMMDGVGEEDRISIELFNQELDHPIYIAPQKKENFNISHIFDRIEKYAQSYRNFLAEGMLDLSII